MPGASGVEERDNGALGEQNGVPVTENEHALTGALVAESRGFTQDSPRDGWATHQQQTFGAEAAQNALSETTPEPWVRSTW